MFQERKGIIKNYVHEYNEILKLYIRIRQNFEPKEIKNSLTEFENSYFDYKKENIDSVSASKITTFEEDFQSEQALNKDIAADLVKNFTNKNNSVCILSFSQYSDNISHRNDNPNENINDNFKDVYLHDLIEYFIFKLDESTKNGNRSNTYSIQYGILSLLQKHDLLDGYQKKGEFQKLKSGSFTKSKTGIISKKSNTFFNKNVHERFGPNENFEAKIELKDFNKKIRKVNFSNVETLKDILKYATKNKNVFLKTNDSIFHTLVVIEDLGKGIVPMSSLYNVSKKNTSTSEHVTGTKFYFFNIRYANGNNETLNINREEGKKVYYETQKLLQEYVEGNLKNKKKIICSSVCKILYEIFFDLTRVHLKLTLYEPEDNEYEKNEKNEKEENIIDREFEKTNIIKHLCKNDLELKEHLHFCTKNIRNDVKMINQNKDAWRIENAEEKHKERKKEKKAEEEKENILIKDETYHKIDTLLFENIDVDQSTKNKVIQEARSLPENLFSYLKWLSSNFQNSYTAYKEEETQFQTEILNLIDMQNAILKNYKDEQNFKIDEINEICEQINQITKKNASIKKELEKHEHLHSQYVKREDNEELKETKRLDTFQDALHEEYDSFLKFRSKLNHENGKQKNKKTKKKDPFISSSSSSFVYEKKKGTGDDENNENETKRLDMRYEMEYQHNLLEAEKYTKENFQKAYDLKNEFDKTIKEKQSLHKLLRNTAQKLNEKTNSLKNDFKNTKDLKLIYPIEGNYTDFEKYENEQKNKTNKRVLINKTLNEYNMLLTELSRNEFNDKELQWINKIYSIAKNF